jgi:hypothetical protein
MIEQTRPRVRITTGVKLRGPERSEGHVSFNSLVGRQCTHSIPELVFDDLPEILRIPMFQFKECGVKRIVRRGRE